MVMLINRIANVQPPMPPLTQDDTDISYCNADKMPKEHDTAMDGEPIAYCPHVIELKLGEVYEFLMVDDDRTHKYLFASFHSYCMNIEDSKAKFVMIYFQRRNKQSAIRCICMGIHSK